MLAVVVLVVAATIPTRFDLICHGQNTFIGFNGRTSIPYDERFSVDLTARLYTDSDHVKPTKIAEISDQIVWLEHELGGNGMVRRYLAVSRFGGDVNGEIDAGDGHKIELQAVCEVEPFTRWDHRVF